MTPYSPAPAFVDQSPLREAFLEAVDAGLSGPRKSLPCKYFYDEQGSALFERICDLPEYYPTRTEIGILRTHGAEIASMIGPACRLVDFGAGSSLKARLLLEALDRPSSYVPVDISREHLLRSAASIARDHPGLKVEAVCADYTKPFHLPGAAQGRGATGFFPGSTIGNFTPAGARRFLSVARGVLEGGPMVVGVDLRKARSRLEAAYDDAAGVTARFNLNLLVRINRELNADFRIDRFRHRAFYDSSKGRVEMHLESLCDQRVRIDGTVYSFRAGETIHTENSYKYTIAAFGRLARAAGYRPARLWTDRAGLFSLFFLESAEDGR